MLGHDPLICKVPQPLESKARSQMQVILIIPQDTSSHDSEWSFLTFSYMSLFPVWDLSRNMSGLYHLRLHLPIRPTVPLAVIAAGFSEAAASGEIKPTTCVSSPSTLPQAALEGCSTQSSTFFPEPATSKCLCLWQLAKQLRAIKPSSLSSAWNHMKNLRQGRELLAITTGNICNENQTFLGWSLCPSHISSPPQIPK